jgi:hypothetical protein
MITRRRPSIQRGLVAGVGLLAGLAISARGAEVVILKDGFVIQGNVTKEMTSINDPATGKIFPMVKGNGLDMVDEGPKFIIFSKHARQLGEISKDVKLRPEYRAYRQAFLGRKGFEPLPAGAVTKSSTEFNDKWRRTIEVRVPQGFDRIEQQITYIDPYFTYMVSPTHIWRQAYRTNELDPQKIRKLLSTHPELAEPEGKPDAVKRVAVAKFMLDVGWLQFAKDDVEQIRKDFPGGVPQAARESFDSLVKEIDLATAALVVNEAELALNAGRYRYAGELLGVFPEKMADARQIEAATKLMAQHKTALERYDNGRRLLGNLIDEVKGLDRARAAMAAGGGPVAAVWKRRTPAANVTTLLGAAETVYTDLHPDSAHRIEFFVRLAEQVERERRQGRDATKKPEELLATVASGWAKGKNGATTEPDAATRVWLARTIVLEYQRANDLNRRNELAAEFKQSKLAPLDELSQIISMLPPAEPENLNARTGTPVPAEKGIPPGVYRRNTPAVGTYQSGIPYYVKLPPEYHHGRAYPVLIVLTHPSIDAEQALGSLARESDRNGYIVLAPDWASQFGKGWQWNGDDHVFVTAVLRDAVEHFCVDNDRVFLFGAADGANMAMDVGMSHPDLFAGVLAMGPIPKWINLFQHYWANAGKLPFYCVTGEISGDSAGNLRKIYAEWMPKGFPGILSLYKGRGIEWYGSELPVMFDWMGRKKRVSGKATLALDSLPRPPFATMRQSDNRFYWLGIDRVSNARLIENLPAGHQISPATIQGDIKGNFITIRTLGVSRLSVWLTHDLIDWSKPVRVNVNGEAARGYKAKVLEPDLAVLLEDYRERGDRRVLVLGRLEFTAVP